MAESNHLNAFMLTLGQNWLYNVSKKCHLSSSTDGELNAVYCDTVTRIIATKETNHWNCSMKDFLGP